MLELVPARMTFDEFIAWEMEQLEGSRFELLAGEVIAMAPERSGDVPTKANVWRGLTEAVETAGLRCDIYPDGMTSTIDAKTVYEPDVVVRRGPHVPDDTVKLDDPVIVAEVLSPSTRSDDLGAGRLTTSACRRFLIT